MKKKKSHKALIIIAILFVAAAISIEAVREDKENSQYSAPNRNCRCVRTIENPEHCTWECFQKYSTKRTPPISENVPYMQNGYGAR